MFVNDLHHDGIHSDGGDSDLLQTGLRVCDLITSGISPAEIAARLLYNSDSDEGPGGVNAKQADDLVNDAVAESKLLVAT